MSAIRNAFQHVELRHLSDSGALPIWPIGLVKLPSNELIDRKEGIAPLGTILTGFKSHDHHCPVEIFLPIHRSARQARIKTNQFGETLQLPTQCLDPMYRGPA